MSQLSVWYTEPGPPAHIHTHGMHSEVPFIQPVALMYTARVCEASAGELKTGEKYSAPLNSSGAHLHSTAMTQTWSGVLER